MENEACAAGAVETAQVVVAVVVTGRRLSRGHLALIDVWGRGVPGRRSAGREMGQQHRPGPQETSRLMADLGGASLCPSQAWGHCNLPRTNDKPSVLLQVTQLVKAVGGATTQAPLSQPPEEHRAVEPLA